MAKKAENGEAQTALATTSTDALAAELEELDLETDGLEEVDNEDIKIPAKVWNFKGTTADDEPIAPNVFYDTITEQTQREVSGSLLTLHKSNEWREYDEGEGRSRVRCRSFDRKIGTMEDGVTRPCEGCPDAKWTTDDNGKRGRRCGPVYNVTGVEDNGQPFILRCKRTSLTPIQKYLNQHFIGRRMVKGARKNWPLFAFSTRVILKMSDDKKYSVPVFEIGEPHAAADISALAKQAKFYREVIMPALAKASEAEGDGDAPPREDASFNPNEFVDDGTAPATGNRF